MAPCIITSATSPGCFVKSLTRSTSISTTRSANRPLESPIRGRRLLLPSPRACTFAHARSTCRSWPAMHPAFLVPPTYHKIDAGIGTSTIGAGIRILCDRGILSIPESRRPAIATMLFGALTQAGIAVGSGSLTIDRRTPRSVPRSRPRLPADQHPRRDRAYRSTRYARIATRAEQLRPATVDACSGTFGQPLS